MNPTGNIIFILSVTLAVASCKGKPDEKAKSGRPTSISAEGFVVKQASFDNIYTTSGSLIANEEIEIHPEVPGRVTGIFFTEGAQVKKGQTLIQLNDAEARASVQKLQAQKKLQQKLQERQKELVNIGGISQQDYEATQTQIQSIDADIAFYDAQLRATRIVAPFDGTIGIRNISNGAIINQNTLITTLKQTHQLKMDFTIPDQYRNMVETGKEVKFSVAGSLDTTVGKISAIDPGADANTRTIRVRAIVANADKKFTAGSFAHVIIPFSSDANAILIPSQAVIPTTKDKKVARLKGGKAELVTVQLGTRTSDKVQVMAGLNAGDTIITTGIMQVKPGMDVKITKLRD